MTITLTHDQATKQKAAVEAAVAAFASAMDVDASTALNALFGALLAAFFVSNGAATRAELEALLVKLEDRLPAATALDQGAQSVEVPE
jgi:hypothetical protein